MQRGSPEKKIPARAVSEKKKKVVQAENSPPPHHSSNGPSLIEDNTKIRQERILNLEARRHEAQVETQALKKQLREVDKTVNNTKDSLEFTQGEHDDLVERVANCENEQSTCWDELTHLNIYSR